MNLVLLKFNTYQEGLKELLDTAYSMEQNFRSRIDAPILQNNTNLWNTSIDSKTIQLYGGVNDDKRHCFKIDHAFNLEKLIKADISSDYSIAIDPTTYSQSQGTEFIVISKSEFKKAKAYYAIRADKYQKIKEELNKGNYSVKDLEKAGGFKVCEWLTPDEAEKHDGWLELAVGKNKASQEDYARASELVKSYVEKADTHNHLKRFSDRNMGFFVETGLRSIKVRSWFVGDSDYRSSGYRSYADVRSHFGNFGRFLWVRGNTIR